MSSSPAGKFQDHYQVLGLEAKADSEAVQKAYTILAARFHANNKDTADPEKFAAVTQAYEVLADPAARAAFDSVRSGPEKDPAASFSGREFFDALAAETRRRQAILCLLYDRRRSYPLRPSLSLRQIESMMTSASDEVQFSIWYLRQKGYATSDDKSNLQISVSGMEYLEHELPAPDDILGLIRGTETHTVEPAQPPAPPASAVAREPFTKPLVPPSAQQTAPSRPISIPRKTIVIPPRPQKAEC